MKKPIKLTTKEDKDQKYVKVQTLGKNFTLFDMKKRQKAVLLRESVSKAQKRKEMEEKALKREKVVKDLTASFISSRLKEGKSYKDIRFLALEGLSKINENKNGYSKEKKDILEEVLNEIVEYTVRKENYYVCGEFPLVYEAPSIRR